MPCWVMEDVFDVWVLGVVVLVVFVVVDLVVTVVSPITSIKPSINDYTTEQPVVQNINVITSITAQIFFMFKFFRNTHQLFCHEMIQRILRSF